MIVQIDISVGPGGANLYDISQRLGPDATEEDGRRELVAMRDVLSREMATRGDSPAREPVAFQWDLGGKRGWVLHLYAVGQAAAAKGRE
jgi:hypothetical protein